MPAAKQDRGERQDTLVRFTKPCASAGLGLVCTAQEVPFQFSIRVFSLVPEPSLEEPAARQELAELQETDASFAPVAPLGLGTDTEDHPPALVQLWATGLEAASPTAMQVVAVPQETSSIAFWALPSEGLGAVCNDQEVPFQRSTSGL